MVSQRRRRPTSREQGSTGTNVFNGIVYEHDYNTDWRGTNRYLIPEKMVKSDGTVSAGMSALKLPLLGLEYTVEPPDDTPIRKEQAEFCQSQILNMSISMDYYMTHVLRMLDFGSYPFEKVWERSLLPNGQLGIGLKKLAPRHPKTIKEWHVDLHGSPRGVLQQVNNLDLTPTEVFIPVRDLLIFVHEQEGSDFKGQSILRAAYKHWSIKQGMESVDAVAKEKRGMGIDVVELTAEATTDDEEKFEAALQTIRTHERNYMVYRADKGIYRIEGVGESGTLDTIASIELHDIRILRALLAEYIAVGTGQSGKFGSYAMHTDKTSITFLAIQTKAKNILDTHNRHLIRQLIDFNWGPLEKDEYPKMRHSRLDTREVQPIAQALTTLTGSGLITPTPELERELRELLELPPLVGSATGRRVIPPVRERQVDSLTALGRKFFESRDLNALVNVSVPFKSEAATFYQQGNSPLDLVSARSKANHEADMLKEMFVQIMVDFFDEKEFDEDTLRQSLMEAH